MSTTLHKLRVQSIVGDRAKLASELNLNFGGRKRDVYASAGYDGEITYKKFLARYLRQDVASRIVDVFADESWRINPEILDGLDDATALDDTEFTIAWQQIATTRMDGPITRRGLTHYLHRLDKVSGIGTYAVLYLGLADGGDPKAEARENGFSDLTGLLFASVFDEGSAEIKEIDEDPQSPRYGMPTLYKLTTNNDDSFEAHWTRCIHVADKVLTSDTQGSSRLEAVWNRLIDLDKVAAATGESGWRQMMPGYVFSTKDGFELGDDSDEHKEQLDEFTHELRRWLELNGMDVQELGGTLQDPTGAIDNILKLISAGTGIPLRKLTGSERGQLASTQDDDNWIDIIEARQTQHVTPAIIQPTINRLIWLGILPPPQSETYTVWWPSLRQKSPKDIAEIASVSADALQKVSADVDPAVFAQTYLPDLPVEAVLGKKAAPAPVLPGQAADPNADPDADPTQDDAADAAQGGMPAANAGGFRWVVYP